MDGVLIYPFNNSVLPPFEGWIENNRLCTKSNPKGHRILCKGRLGQFHVLTTWGRQTKVLILE